LKPSELYRSHWIWHVWLDKKDYSTLRQLGKGPAVSTFQIRACHLSG
jgi:hypothetical protein